MFFNDSVRFSFLSSAVFSVDSVGSGKSSAFPSFLFWKCSFSLIFSGGLVRSSDVSRVLLQVGSLDLSFAVLSKCSLFFLNREATAFLRTMTGLCISPHQRRSSSVGSSSEATSVLAGHETVESVACLRFHFCACQFKRILLSKTRNNLGSKTTDKILFFLCAF